MKYCLDNAGIIFPMTYTKEIPNSFKLSAYFYEDINKEILQKALNETFKRFHSFNVTLKNGVFWHYFATNKNELKVSLETKEPFLLLDPLEKDRFVITVLYEGSKISVEFFHALTDANGGLEFLKCLCYYYLTFKGININNNDTILTNDVKEDKTECIDSFCDNYNKKIEKSEKAKQVLKIDGTDSEVISDEIILSISKLKEICKEKNCTITEYLGAVVLYSYYLNTKEINIEKKDLALFIPVNARKYYNSKSLKNFMLYIRSYLETDKEVTLDGVIDSIRNTLRNELSKEYLDGVIKSNVSIQKNFFLNYMFLFIKKRIMKIGYKKVAGGTVTVAFSNIQEVKTPEVMKDYIDRFSFIISPSKSLRISTSVVSYKDKLSLMFTRNIIEANIIDTVKEIVSKLQ